MSYPSDALRFANKVLRKIDCTEQSELARGRRLHPITCPISNTISAGIEAEHSKDTLLKDQESFDVQAIYSHAIVWASKWNDGELVDRAEIHFPVPKGAAGFMERFDQGKYPQFDSGVKL